jgi:hypothetical protein
MTAQPTPLIHPEIILKDGNKKSQHHIRTFTPPLGLWTNDIQTNAAVDRPSNSSEQA